MAPESIVAWATAITVALAAAGKVIGDLTKAARKLRGLRVSQPRMSTPPVDKRVVLIVDDDRTDRRLLIHALISIERVRIDTADGYAAGLVALVEAPTPPAVAVIDLGLPGGDGCELARLARLAHKSLVVLLDKGDLATIRARVVAALTLSG